MEGGEGGYVGVGRKREKESAPEEDCLDKGNLSVLITQLAQQPVFPRRYCF